MAQAGCHIPLSLPRIKQSKTINTGHLIPVSGTLHGSLAVSGTLEK